jgi:hypothetical protein
MWGLFGRVAPSRGWQNVLIRALLDVEQSPLWAGSLILDAQLLEALAQFAGHLIG